MIDNEVYRGLEPAEVWRHFAALNSIPRPSGQEAAARAYVQQVAAQVGATWDGDERGNTVVRVPATNGVGPTVAIQAHLDMVCEKRPDVAHKFATDPIRPRREGERIYASGTTLGADNGIGAAMALALLTSPGLRHGPLELIFTVEEETGLHGALELDPGLITARMLINLDSEDPKELTIGCAGGAGTILTLPVTFEAPPRDWQGCEIVVSGLQGGHSGVQIHENLANAIKLLTGALLYIQDATSDFRIGSIAGGSAHNAIPRDAVASLAVAPDAVSILQEIIGMVQAEMRAHWQGDEPNLKLELRAAPVPGRVMTQREGRILLDLLDELPHGVVAMSQAFVGKVETSSNLAVVTTGESEVEIATSSRSFMTEELRQLQDRIGAMGLAAGARVEARDGYPGWQPQGDARLTQVTEAVYRHTFGYNAEVQVVHAGLECGVIVAKLLGLEAISFGPLIRGAHTPEEYIDIASVGTTWQLLVALLAALAA